jgi:glutathione S-transferase
MSKLIVYGLTASTYVRTVRLLLEEIGAEYTLQSVNIFNGENQTAEYLAKHPFGKVPTLEVDGELLYETAAITQYLDTVLANHKYSPITPILQARMRQIMGIVDGYLYAPAIGTIVIQRLTGKIDEAKLTAAIPLAKKALDAIEYLVSPSPYLLGSEITIADFYLIPLFVYLSQTPEFAAVTAQTPKLLAWWERVSQLPNVKEVCK